MMQKRRSSILPAKPEEVVASNRAPWSELSNQAKLERFQELKLPPEVEYVYENKGGPEMEFPLGLLFSVLDKLIRAGYVTFNFDLMHESGMCSLYAMMIRDHDASLMNEDFQEWLGPKMAEYDEEQRKKKANIR